VTDLLALPPDDEEEDGSRGRAVWGLVALAIIAALIVVILLATSGSGGHKDDQALTSLSHLPSQPASTGSSLTTAASSASSSTSASSTATTAIPTSTANPCPGAAPCAVPGDAGQLVAAVNRYRTAHGRSAVSGNVSAQAQQCALKQGDGPACAPSFAWEPVPTQDGPKAIGLVTGRSDGVRWLLDPGMKSFSVGWAYAGGQYECAILKIT